MLFFGFLSLLPSGSFRSIRGGAWSERRSLDGVTRNSRDRGGAHPLARRASTSSIVRQPGHTAPSSKASQPTQSASSRGARRQREHLTWFERFELSGSTQPSRSSQARCPRKEIVETLPATKDRRATEGAEHKPSRGVASRRVDRDRKTPRGRMATGRPVELAAEGDVLRLCRGAHRGERYDAPD